MPVSQNPKECGWFYHAPAKKEPGRPRVDYVAPSNLPGMGFDDPSLQQKDTVKEMLFKETDSEYIRLAKMGGRKDLLSFNPDRYRKKSQEPIGYPRNEWFYLEDNRREDEEKKPADNQEWRFLLPDYMVHKGYQPSFERPDAAPVRSAGPVRSAAPYYTEATSVMKEEGRFATDKTVKIAEHRRPGYGVRSEKYTPATQQSPLREKFGKAQDFESVHGEKKRKPNSSNHVYSSDSCCYFRPTEKEEPTNMSKLLAGEYEKQWYTKRAEMLQQNQPGVSHGRPETEPADANPRTTYYHQKYDGGLPPKRTDDEEEKELFKLSRFKNIPSKLDSQQRAEIMATLK
ncbi:unnamed protein product [Candidula unifasciata]|uniref:Uncharacterized protein n=1 Tax=Candidula unifasciata TaxID=100452 RepID=A0A8S3YWN4_9EUPU|nr:unnamed protein product [Candidula unifasciata]